MPNNDLISREALLHEIEYHHPEYNDGQDVANWQMLCIRMAPSVDAVPVVHGRWIPEYEEMETLVGVYGYTQVRNVLTGWSCSVCGRCEGLPREEMPYCHCGAKMDLEGDNG